MAKDETEQRARQVLADVRRAAAQVPQWAKDHVARMWREYYENGERGEMEIRWLSDRLG